MNVATCWGIKIKYVTVTAKTVLIGTFSIARKINLKYSSCCTYGSVVLDFSHAKFTVAITRVVI